MSERRPAGGPEPAGASGRTRRRLRRIAAVVGGGLLVVVLIAGAGLTWLVATPAGLRFAVDQAGAYLPEGVDFESAQGRLIGPLTLRGLQVRTDAADVRVDRIALDWRPAALLRERLHVQHIEVEGVDVALAASASDAEAAPLRLAAPPRELALPVAVMIDRVAVDRIRVRGPQGPLAAVDRVRLGARADAERIALTDLRVEAPAGRVSGRLSLATPAPHAAAGRLDWRLQGAAERPALGGRLRIDGTLADLGLDHALSEPTAARVRARLRAFGDDPSWRAEVVLPETRPADWLANAPDGTLAADLDLEGSFSRVRVQGGFRLGELHGGPYEGELDLAADADRAEVRRLVLRPVGEDGVARLAGAIGYGGADPLRLDLQLDWQRLQWPLRGPPEAASRDGRLALEGALDDFGFELAMRASRPGTALPPATVTLEGRGSTQALPRLTGEVAWAGGRLGLDGRIGWAEAPGARLSLALEGLPLAAVSEGRLEGHVDARGEVDVDWGDTLVGELRLGDLGGTLNGHSIDGGARVRYDDGALGVSRLELAVGDARASVAGRVDRRVDIEWSLRIPELGALYRPAGGRLEGEGTIRGEREAPTVAGELRGDGLRWSDVRIGRLELRAPAVSTTGAATIDLALSDVVIAERPVDRLSARLEGTPVDHRLRLEVAAPRGTARLALTGGLDGSDWRGRLVALQLGVQDADWRLAAPSALSRVDGVVTLERTCLARAPAQLCLAASGAPGDWRARLEGNDVPYALAGAFGPEVLGYTGRFALQATLAGGSGPVTGSGRIDLGAGHVTGPTDEGRSRLLGWQAGTLEASLQSGRVDARLDLPLADGGRIAASAGVERSSPHGLAGELVARVDDPSIVAALVPQLGSVAGRLEADLTLGGTIEAPRVSGSAALADGRVGVVPLGIELRELGVSVDTRGGAIRLRAEGRSGKGRLQASLGVQKADTGGWAGEGAIRGEDFLAAAVPELELTVSPDLRWRVDDRLVRLEGSLELPRARIEPRDLSGAVQSSPDAVVVDASGESTGASGADWRVDASVDVRFGDAVRIDAFGLDARLGGAIDIRERPGKPTTGTGELRVEEGTYSIYRQTLEIERGRVLFEGGPLANPGLDVRAVRRPRDVVVGVNVRGSLREPRAELFSEPPMPESEQLSYLIAGVPLRGDGGSGSDRATMAAVAGALAGSEQGRRLAGQLGIDEVSVDRSGGAGASLVLGRYLSPRLYVGYGIGLAEQANSVRMRYELTRRWTLEGQSGVESGADLLYTIETD